MSDLGELLKKARFEKGIKLEELQETTKIQKRYLEAIEEGNFSILPGNFYVRAFIKSYSEAVGLDPEEVIRLYRNVIPQAAPETKIETNRKNRQKSIQSDRYSKWASTILMWCFPLIILIALYIFFDKYYEGKPTAPDEPNITEEQEEILQEPIVVVPTLPVPVEPVEEVEEWEDPDPIVTYINSDASTHIYNVSNTDQLNVELIVTGSSCWVWVKRDNAQGAVINETTFTRNQTEIWEVDHSLWIRLGLPSNVEVYVNGILIDHANMKGSNPLNLQINLVLEAE